MAQMGQGIGRITAHGGQALVVLLVEARLVGLTVAVVRAQGRTPAAGALSCGNHQLSGDATMWSARQAACMHSLQAPPQPGMPLLAFLPPPPPPPPPGPGSSPPSRRGWVAHRGPCRRRSRLGGRSGPLVA